MSTPAVDGAALAARWHQVRARVDAACARAGRAAAEVTVVAVSKFHPAAAVRAALAAGVTDLGENYAQELVGKRAELGADGAAARWHFIGGLQRNKAKLVAGQVALIHAVASAELGAELGRRALALGQVQPVLIAVNLGGEASKTGVAPAELPALLAALRACQGVRVDGLMTMPPPADDPEASRPHFRALRLLREGCAQAETLPVLSMGMSDDFEVAIAEGATHVRIGTAIFGARPAAA
ncbi:MAG: YggS family pyridoxal phosphate-dependent enzyme [Kofleriaceae bacterium]|jgi:pyridoxal phosphate enzyme (YggS family)|nr:YggS family pyridoxal phosphate-dependent enzyme [Kofleriaceae bacterium]MBP6841265.1 YggS family pyridoxal phosphate-dependent enzyme [Kofleriaceae bacterium]MBP9207959.1 YggS family pyridoxal phosphate-dependent enzyme [Kofleriaceae bacterium]